MTRYQAMRRQRTRWIWITPWVWLPLFCTIASAQTLFEKNPDLNRSLRNGLTHLYDYHLTQAERVFSQMVSRFPDRPIGYVHMAEIFWWKALVTKRDKRLAQSFKRYTDYSLAKGKAILEKDSTDFYALLYVAEAYSNLSRFKATITRSYFGSVLAGLKGRRYNERAAELRPNYVDCLIGIGAFNYFSGALPSVIKPFAFLIGARGDREEGIRQLELAAQKGEYGQFEARLVLLGVCFNERRFNDYIKMLFNMIDRHPSNPVFYMWLNNAFIKQKRFDEGIRFFNQWVEESGSGDGVRRPLRFLLKEKARLESHKRKS